MAQFDLGRLRGDLEAFQGALMEEFYRNYAGIKNELSTVTIYDRFGHLFSQETVAGIASALEDGAVGDDARCLKYMRAFSTMGYLENAAKELTDRANTMETQSVVSFDGEDIPYRMIPVRLRNEPDHDRRRRLFDAKLVETEKLNAILMERMARLHGLSTELGFRNYKELCASVKMIDYKSIEESVEEMMRRTEKLYEESMDALLIERAGISLKEAWSFDIPYAFRGEEFNTYFDRDRLVPAFFETLRGMGLEPDKYTNIQIDTEDRPKKTPRAFCAPINVPDDVKLVIRPMGGWRDFEAFFHEGGHAWHFGNTQRAHPAEYRYLGDNSVTEAYAFLLNYLPMNRLWLKKYLGMEHPEDYVRFTLVNKLMFLRRYGSKLVYEMKLHQGRLSTDYEEVYRNTLQRGLKFRHTGKHFLEDVDDAFYCAEYLRAWMFEGQLRQTLEEKFGEEWFSNPRTGEYLMELWSYGQKYNADELVKTIGYADIDYEPVVSEIERGLTG